MSRPPQPASSCDKCNKVRVSSGSHRGRAARLPAPGGWLQDSFREGLHPRLHVHPCPWAPRLPASLLLRFLPKKTRQKFLNFLQHSPRYRLAHDCHQPSHQQQCVQVTCLCPFLLAGGALDK